MKKIIAVLLIMLFLGSSSLWAIDVANATIGIGGMGLGASLFLLGSMDEDTTTKILCYASGGLIGGLGLVLFILSLTVDDTSYVMAENNTIFKHVSFAAWEDKVYFGVRFEY